MDADNLNKQQLLDIVAQQSEKIAALEQQLRLLLNRQYGRKSEAVSADQLNLFSPDNAPTPDEDASDDVETVTVSAHTKNRGKRKPLDADLERQTIHYELPDDQRQCDCGDTLKDIGTQASEQIDFIPARVVVIEHVQHKYACSCCQTAVRIAPKPAQPLPKSNAAPGLLAHIATTKFVDSVPLHRQEAQFARINVQINRNTMSRWLIQLGQLIVPLLNLMEDAIRAGPYIQCDETPFQVLKEVGRAAAALSYMWVRRGGAPGRHVILYHYAPSRAGAVACQLLEDYKGYLQCDGYSGYSVLESQGIILVGCMAHVRRKFNDAMKAASKKEISAKAKSAQALRFIKQLYAIEDRIKELSDQECLATRQAEALPVLNEFKAWLDEQQKVALPKSPLGKAIGYAQNQWQKIIRYCDQGYLEIDNNRDERAIRPFAIGRRNWLFSDTPDGAHTNARFYSLIETCKLHGVEPYAYLRQIFKELPAASTVADYEALLPWNITLDNLA